MRSIVRHSFQALSLMLLISPFSIAAEPVAGEVGPNDWPWWRGPARDGVAVGAAAPLKWSATSNIAWQAEVPGRGHSSPTVIGSLVVLQTSNETAKTQSVVAFDRSSGKRLWQTTINSGGFPTRIHRRNTHASPTIAADGTRLFAAAYHHQAIHVTALDMSGKKLWQKKIGPFRPDEYKNGYAASPIVYGKHLIVLAECDDSSYMVSLERSSGKLAWRIPRPARISYSSPILARVAGRNQVLIPGCDRVAGFDPDTGKGLWEVPATTMATSGTMVWYKDLVFASGGFPKAETVCIKADGSGKIAWKNNHRIHEQSLLVHEGHVYGINDTGIALCWETRTGQEVWRHRLKAPISASPTLVDDTIYLTNELGKTWLYRATPKGFDEIAVNQLGTIVFASATICGGQIFFRVADMVDGKRVETLYCLERAAGR